MRTARRGLGVVVVCLVWLLNPPVARAQASGRDSSSTVGLARLGSLCELQQNCAKVSVTSTDGVERRGIVRSLSAGGLVLDVEGATRTLPLAEVRRVTRADSAANGTLIGFGVGALIGYSMAGPGCLDDNDCQVGVFPILTGAIFAGIFGLLDVAHQGRVTVYEAPRSTTPTVRIAPLLGRRALGFQVSVRNWR